MTQTNAPAGAETALRLAEDSPLDDEALRTLRRFHLDIETPPALPSEWMPAALHAYRSSRIRGPYPLFIARGESGALLVRTLPTLLDETAPKNRVLRDNLLRLEASLRERIDARHDRDRRIPALELLEAAGHDVGEALSLPESEAQALDDSISDLVTALPSDAVFLSLSSRTPFELLAVAAESRFEAAHSARRPEWEEAVAVATRRLATDEEARTGRRPEAVAATLGALGSRFLDSGALANLTGATHQGRELSEERRQLLQLARDTLRDQLTTLSSPRGTASDAGFEAPEGWSLEATDAPCRRAVEIFDTEAERLASALRAAHRIRLEASGDFDPDRHQPWLEHLSWKTFDREELALVPPVVVLVSASILESGEMVHLSRLLLSGRPIQVLVIPDLEKPVAASEISHFRFEPGFLGLAHRQAFVQQASVARPETLMAGFRAALDGSRSGLHVVAGSPAFHQADLDPWLIASATVEGRTEPQFRFDPEAGGSWARRLTLTDNPAEGEDWSKHSLRVRRPGAKEELLPVSFTAADSLLLTPRAAGHFIPAGGSADDLEPLDQWLDRELEEAATRLPFVWAADASGTLQRLVVSRRLAEAVRDRLGFWRTLQELAGIHNEHVETAARLAREESRAAAKEEWQRTEAKHLAELERVRQGAAEEAVDKLITALFDLEPGELVPAVPGTSFAGQNVDELTRQLMRVVGEMNGGPIGTEGSIASPATAAETASESVRVDELAAELMGLIDDSTEPDGKAMTPKVEETNQ